MGEPMASQSVPPVINMSLSFDKWPSWAKWFSERYKHGDTGVGDVAERLFGTFGGEVFKLAFKNLTGKDCGCSGRKDNWNKLYPLPL